MALTAIILAAGKSTRMKTHLPKVLHEVCGKPMLHYILEACYGAGCSNVVLVVGHGKEQVMAEFAGDKRIKWVEQTEQLGTGHAAKIAVQEMKAHGGNVFILAGDGPLIRAEVLQTLLRVHQEERAAASMATAILSDPTGYGRVLRDQVGDFIDIIEELDCTPAQREIREVFPSYYCFKTDELTNALGQLTTNNCKHEYYLTDVYGILRRAKKKVVAVQAVPVEDILSINTRQQQAEVDAILQDRIQRQIRESGATIVSGVNVYIEAGVKVGRDTVINPFVFIGRDSTIGPECVIGPYACIPAESIVREGSNIRGNCSEVNS